MSLSDFWDYLRKTEGSFKDTAQKHQNTDTFLTKYRLIAEHTN